MKKRKHHRGSAPPQTVLKKNRHTILVGVVVCLGVVAGVTAMIFFGRPAPSTTQKSISLAPALALLPTSTPIFQGDPVMIVINNAASSTNVKSANVKTTAVQTAIYFGLYNGKLTALYGVPLASAAGTSTVTVILKNGTQLKTSFLVKTRTKPEEYLPVPAQLGGNSPANQEQLVSTLDQENDTLKDVYSSPTISFWSLPFTFPVASPVVTDGYGYIRDSGVETIVHQGTDFKAPPGTPVRAINRGIVRLSHTMTAYGNTIVIDHGLGVESLYMHLSAMVVSPGQTVTRGQLIGYSGETGYSEGPHLHLSVKIDGYSIDPMKFLALFKK